MLAQTGDAALVARLAPKQPGEAEAARRARLLYERVSMSLGLRPATLPQVLLHACYRVFCDLLTASEEQAR